MSNPSLESALGALFGSRGLAPVLRWNFAEPLGTPVKISFCFSEVAPAYLSEFSQRPFRPLDEGLRKVARNIFSEISRFTNISFVEKSGAVPSEADIAISGRILNAAPYAYDPPDSELKSIQPSNGDIVIDVSLPSDGPGYPGVLVTDWLGDGSYTNFGYIFRHELGHALGLLHPSNYSIVDGHYKPDSRGYQVQIDPKLNDLTWTVMSYLAQPSIRVDNTYEGPTSYDQSYMYLDILALQLLYGANRASTAADDIYRLPPSNLGFRTLWDASGDDTLDLSNQRAAAAVDLRDGATSSIGINAAPNIPEKPYVDNVVIGPNTVIENVVGTPFGDSLIGNEAGNTLTGGGGNDSLDGGDGVDRARFVRSSSDYRVSSGPAGISVQALSGDEGLDVLQHVERLQFADRNLAFDLAGSAGLAARLIGLVFGPEQVQNPHFVALALRYLDGGGHDVDLAQIALDVRLGATASHGDVVDLLYANLTGVHPGAEAAKVFIDLLDKGTYSPATLTLAAAWTDLEAQRIDLVGLSASGLEYEVG